MSSSSSSFASKRCLAPQPKVILRVTDQEDGGLRVYRVGTHAHLKKLMLDYCQRRNLEYGTLRFIFKGRFLSLRQTPAQLMMKDDDIIEAVMDDGRG